MGGTGEAADDGLRIVLTPAQLAAVMQGETLFETENLWNRVVGGVTVLGGALELAASAALLLTPEPTMVTKVGGVALAVHGSDTASAGLVQLWSGRQQSTLTAQTASAAARLAGVSPDRANRFGTAVDVLVPLIVAGAVAAARAIAVRRGVISLAAEEAAGGHTLARHVGKTEAELRARLAAQARIPAASTFATREAAERAVSEVLRRRAAEIADWARGSGPQATRAFDADLGRVVGEGVVRATGQLTGMTAVRVVLRKEVMNGRLYFVLTAFPIP